MAVIADTLLETKFLENSQTTQYTSVAVKTIIDKMTVSNNTGSAATFAVNLVPSGGSAGSSNVVIPTTTIQPGQDYLCPEVVGHILRAGDFISTIAGTASALVCRISGRTVS